MKLNYHFPSTTEVFLEQTNIFWQFYDFLWNIVIGLRFPPSCVTAQWYQFGCGISKMVGPKKQDIWPRINIPTQRKKKKNFHRWMTVCQKVSKSYFLSQFSISKLDDLGAHLVKKQQYFEPLHFLRLCPIHRQTFFSLFPLSMFF
jgi:hypothetical protein